MLPAVLGTRDLLLQSRWVKHGYQKAYRLTLLRPRLVAGVVLLAASVGLTGIGVRPNLLFALLWVSPLLIILSLQALMGEPFLFEMLGRGDWRLVIACAVSALVCGFFWEMWNYFSLARWVYRIPFVDRFRIFEMPVLGYAGYLPFGLQCAVIGAMLEKALGKSKTAEG